MNKQQILSLIEKYANQFGADPVLVAAIAAKESSFNPNAVGRAGEIGLMQLLPSGAIADYEIFNKPLDNYAEINNNLTVACWYIGKRIPQMLKHYNKPVTLENIVISYNAGIGRVLQGGAPPRITQEYIVFVREFMNENRKNQGFALVATLAALGYLVQSV